MMQTQLVHPTNRSAVHGYRLLHHLLVAAAISAAVVLLEHSGSIRLVEGLAQAYYMMLLSAEWTMPGSASPPEDRLPPPGFGLPRAVAAPEEIPVPQVITVPPELAPGLVGVLDPLSLSDLRSAITRILDQKPSAFVMTFDANDGPAAYMEADLVSDNLKSEFNALKDELSELGKTLDSAAQNHIVVVWTVGPVSRAAEFSPQRLAWLRDRCRAGVKLAIWDNPGNSAFYSVELPTAGVVAAQGLLKSNARAISQRGASAFERRTAALLEMFRNCDAVKSPDRWRNWRDEFNQGDPTWAARFSLLSLLSSDLGRPYNPRFWQLQDVETSLTWSSQSNLPGGWDEIKIDPRQPVVFGLPMRVVTRPVVGARSFPYSVAETIYAETHVLSPVGYLKGFVGDILLGFLTGLLFEAVWSKFAASARHLRAYQTSAGNSSWSPFLKRYAVTRLWLLLALSLLILICYEASRYSARLMMSDIWLNPIPIVLGMFLHSLLSSRRAPDEPYPTNVRAFVLTHPDLLIEIPLIVTALTMLVSAT